VTKVVQFRDFHRPEETAPRDREAERAQSAIVIILPVVRIEHYDQFLDDDPPPKRKKRRPF